MSIDLAGSADAARGRTRATWMKRAAVAASALFLGVGSMKVRNLRTGNGIGRSSFKGRAFGLILAAFALTLVSATSSSASPSGAAITKNASCATTGASGSVKTVNGADPTGVVTVTLRVKDTSADGHHVRVRFLHQMSGTTIKKWPWHSNHDGNSTTSVWNTTAQTSYGIYEKGVEVARFEGNTLLNSCTDWG